jgi:hypothetical protein
MNSCFTLKSKNRLIAGGKVLLPTLLLSAPLIQAQTLKEGLDVEASIKTGIRHDDNISQNPDGGPKNSSVIHVIQPAIKVGASGSKISLNAEYSLLSEFFVYDSEDDHTDHNLNFDSEFRLDRRNTFGLSGGYHELEAVRTSINRADPNEQSGDQSTTTNLDGRYLFGAPSAIAQFELQAGQERKRYDNNMNTASNNRLREYDADRAAGTLYFRVSPKTQLLAEVVLRDYEYLANTSLLDNEALFYYLGARWELAAKTTGAIRIGNEEKDFDSAGADDIDSTAWDINITYQPKSYSSFILETSKGNAEGNVRANAVTTTSTILSWNHTWSPFWKSGLSYNFMTEKYEGRAFNGREDDTQTAALSLFWMPLRQVEIEMAYSFRTRDSNSAVEDFDRQQAGVSATFYF